MKTAFLLAISFLVLASPGFTLAQDRSREASAANSPVKTSSGLPPSESNGTHSDGDSAEAQKNYENAMILHSAGRVDEAIVALNEANRLKPEDAQFQYQLGMAYVQAKAYKEAADSFRRASRIKPEWAEAQFQFGIASYVLGRRSQYLEAYRKLVSLNSPMATTLNKIINDNSDPVTVREIAKIDRENSSTKPPTPAPTPAESKPQVNAPKIPANTVSETAPLNVDAALTGIYRVGVGDVLDIRFLNSSVNRSTLYTVMGGGVIDLPIVGGATEVGGLTTEEIRAKIASELKRRAVEDGTHVSVGVRQYASHTVIVTGLVNSTGTKVLRREAVPLYVIMAESQPRLDAARAVIMRTGLPPQIIDLSDSAALNTIIKPGDVINVTARMQEFYYIAGRVINPGQKVFQSGITLLQAILAAGGVARPGANTVELSREGEGGLLSTSKVSLKEIKSGKIQDPKLRPGDRIEVLN